MHYQTEGTEVSRGGKNRRREDTNLSDLLFSSSTSLSLSPSLCCLGDAHLEERQSEAITNEQERMLPQQLNTNSTNEHNMCLHKEYIHTHTNSHSIETPLCANTYHITQCTHMITHVTNTYTIN